MSSRRRRRVIIMLAASGLTVAALLLLRERPVRVDELDNIRAGLAPGAIVVIGSWDAPGGRTLSSARHRRTGGRLVLRLGARTTLLGRRLFEVRIPVTSGAPATLHLDQGVGTLRAVPVAPIAPTLGPLAGAAVHLESRSER